MPTMSRLQAAFCRSRPWRALAGNVVLSWSLQEFEPHGGVLEIGAGSGAMAAELLGKSSGTTCCRPRRFACSTSGTAPACA